MGDCGRRLIAGIIAGGALARGQVNADINGEGGIRVGRRREGGEMKDAGKGMGGSFRRRVVVVCGVVVSRRCVCCAG